MLKNIKASFFLELLFFHISERQKLKVARHSKYLQKIIDRRLIHYKIFSERNIIYGQDGKGKEYNCYDELEFEGEYLNGKSLFERINPQKRKPKYYRDMETYACK